MSKVEEKVKVNQLFISLENTMRYLPEGIDRKVFFNIESLIHESVALNNDILIEINLCVGGQEYKLIERRAKFHEKRVVFENYHEDPTVKIGDYFCFAMAIERGLIKEVIKNNNLYDNGKGKGTLDDLVDLDDLSISGKAYTVDKEVKTEIVHLKLELTTLLWSKIWSDELFTEFVDEYQIKVKENCELTLHKTNNKGEYSEESRDLKQGDVLDFKKYLYDYVYLGIQFSINDIYPEVEEKYIVKGQKGMYESNLLQVEDELYVANIVFHEKFLKKMTPSDNFREINTIQELLVYYQEDNQRVKFFEMSDKYLEHNYKSHKTYTQSRVFSKNKDSKFYHLDKEICRDCRVKSICLQNIPSNLSEQLAKKVIYLEKGSDCDFNQIFSKNKRIKSASFD